MVELIGKKGEETTITVAQLKEIFGEDHFIEPYTYPIMKHESGYLRHMNIFPEKFVEWCSAVRKNGDNPIMKDLTFGKDEWR